ncbi:hypothetical protein FHS90_000476 [Rufibacter quisquiliarum]|uniref:Uncharacterized protein n=1 Tax=Rufibacter quisquiliarum TaxID=1549639 RepID=A0A839GGK1_9BACT|nr:hypothetical protein [Rufibacter quisquiliarum]
MVGEPVYSLSFGRQRGVVSTRLHPLIGLVKGFKAALAKRYAALVACNFKR